VKEGGTLQINDIMVKVTGVFGQNFGLFLYTSYDYAKEIMPDFQPAYNVIFAQGVDVGRLQALSHDQGFNYSTPADDNASFALVMESLNTLI